MRAFLHAWMFFTRVRLPASWVQWCGYSPQTLAQSLVHWPGVGGLLGLLCAALWMGLVIALPNNDASLWVAAIVSTAWGVWLTGAMHEDGLADLVDGLGGSLERTRALEIMKDSRVGAYGVLALCVAFLLKCSLLVALAQIDPWLSALALFSGHVISRWLALAIAVRLPYAGEGAASKSQAVLAQVDGRMWFLSALWCLLYGALLWLGLDWPSDWWSALLAGVVLSALAWWWMHQLLWRRLQGFTGDALGAVQQVCELSSYLGVLLGLGWL